MAKLIRNVFAGGEWWGPAHGRVDPPAEVAAEITNLACWDEAPEPESMATPEPMPERSVWLGILAAAEPPVSDEEIAAYFGITDADLAEMTQEQRDDAAWATLIARPQVVEPPAEPADIEHDLPPVPDPIIDPAPDALAEAAEQKRQALTAELADLPDVKDLLLKFAEQHGLDVDGRLGAAKLRAALAAAIGA